MTNTRDRTLNGIHDCPKCGRPCHVVNGRYPKHGCPKR